MCGLARPDEGLPARVAFIRDLGESVQFVLDHEGQTITALFSPQARPDIAALGDEVGVSFAPGGAWCCRHEPGHPTNPRPAGWPPCRRYGWRCFS